MDLDSILGILFFVVFVVLPLFSGSRRKGQGGRGTGRGPQQGQGRPTGQGAGTPASGRPASGAPAAGRPTAATTTDQPSVTLAEIRRRVEEAQRREEERARMRGGRAAADARRPGSLVSSDPFEGTLVSGQERRLSEVGGLPTASALGPEGGAAAGERYVIGPEGSVPQSFPTGGYVIGREGGAGQPRPAAPSVIGREGVGGRPVSPGGLGREGAARARSPLDLPPPADSTRGARRSARAAAAEIGAATRRDSGRPGVVTGKATLGRAGALRTDQDGILAGLIWHEVLSPPRALRHWRER